MNKILVIMILGCFQFYTFAQEVNLRKLTLKSDAILYVEINDIIHTKKYINDYTTEHYVEFERIESVVKNKFNSNFLDKKFRQLEDDEDFYGDLKINGGDCMGIGSILESGKKYYQLYFLKREKKDFVVIAALWNNFDWNAIIENIKSIQVIESIRKPYERYVCSMDWFIENNLYPDPDFIEYYKGIKIITSDYLQLTDSQLIRAKIKFLAGSEALYEMIKYAYPQDIKEYYIQKLMSIKEQDELDWSACYDFQTYYEKATDSRYKFDDSVQGNMKDKLTDVELTVSEKKEIMQSLIEYLQGQHIKFQ